MSSAENPRQECMTCGLISRPGVMTVCTQQAYWGSSTTLRLGSACDWRWVTVIK